MKFYLIKTTEKGVTPTMWYETFVPSGITFTQLYFLLGYVHDQHGFLSPYFTFDYAKDRLEQYSIEGNPSDNKSQMAAFFDRYDADGTYIDTFFRKDVKMTLITSCDFDLKIVVEQDAVDFQEIDSPIIFKMSRAAAGLMGGKMNDAYKLPDAFKMVEDNERHFLTLNELDETYGKETVMYVSPDPVTPPESVIPGIKTTQERFNRILPLLMKDKDLLEPALEYMTTPFYDSVKRSMAVAKMNEILVPRYGKTFLKLMLEDDPLLQRIRKKEDKDLLFKRTHPDLLSLCKLYGKDDLKEFAEELGLKKYRSLSKDDLARRVADEILKPEVLKDRLTSLHDDVFEMFRKAASVKEGVPFDDSVAPYIYEDLEDMLLAAELNTGNLYVPYDLRELYENIWDESCEELRQKRMWMCACCEVAQYYYGVLPWDVMRQLFCRKYKNTDMAEVKELFRKTSDYDTELKEAEDKLVMSSFLYNGSYKIYEKNVQMNKPFYIPSRREIEEVYDKGCEMSSPEYEAMVRFIMRKFGCEKKLAERKVMFLSYAINREATMQEAIDDFQSDLLNGGHDFTLKTNKDAAEFIRLYMNMQNVTHMRCNRGYTPNGLREALDTSSGWMNNSGSGATGGGAAGTGMVGAACMTGNASGTGMVGAACMTGNASGTGMYGAAGMTGNASGTGMVGAACIDARLAGEKRRKIGRNEPCPCGSGKKYKNCCGKN